MSYPYRAFLLFALLTMIASCGYDPCGTSSTYSDCPARSNQYGGSYYGNGSYGSYGSGYNSYGSNQSSGNQGQVLGSGYSSNPGYGGGNGSAGGLGY